MFLLKFFFISLFCILTSLSGSAKNIYPLAEIDPEKTEFNAYFSHKYFQLLVSFINKTPKEFDCQPNQYFFYDLKKDHLHEEGGGNLVVNSNFSHYITTKIHTLGAPLKSNKKKWKNDIKKLIDTFDIAALTLEHGKLSSQNNRTQCWQQPVLKNISHESIQQLPYLMANMCRGYWCSDLYWTEKSSIRFWSHIDPKVFHLIELNLETGDFKLLKKTPQFSQKQKKQHNAPRKNLVNLKTSPMGMISLRSTKGDRIELRWKKTKEKKIKVFLQREKENRRAANQMIPFIASQIKNKKIPQAIQLIQFAFWLDPNNTRVKIEQLKTLSELLLYREFFDYLASAFPHGEKTDICQKVHIGNAFKKIRKLKSFPEKFKKICF